MNLSQQDRGTAKRNFTLGRSTWQMDAEPLRWTRTQFKRLCTPEQLIPPHQSFEKTRKKLVGHKRRCTSKKGKPIKTTLLPGEVMVTPPASELDEGADITEEEKWRGYVNLFNCDQCGVQINDFRL